MSDIYDFIVVGASTEGVNCAVGLAELAKTNNLKVGLVSENFAKFDFSRCDLISRDLFCIPDKVIFAGYNHGLIKLDLANSPQGVFTKNLIIATNTKIDNSHAPVFERVWRRLSDIDCKTHRKSVALVGNGQGIASTALKLAKQTDFVYICCPDTELSITPAKAKKLSEAKNVVVLPKCQVESVSINVEGLPGQIVVALDNNNTVVVDDMVFDTPATPDIPTLPNGFVKLDEAGKIVVNNYFETSEIPGIFAISGCASHSSKNDTDKLITHLKEKYNWR